MMILPFYSVDFACKNTNYFLKSDAIPDFFIFEQCSKIGCISKISK